MCKTGSEELREDEPMVGSDEVVRELLAERPPSLPERLRVLAARREAVSGAWSREITDAMREAATAIERLQEALHDKAHPDHPFVHARDCPEADLCVLCLNCEQQTLNGLYAKIAGLEAIVARLKSLELADEIAASCHDPDHDERACPTCAARDGGIADFREAVLGEAAEAAKEEGDAHDRTR